MTVVMTVHHAVVVAVFYSFRAVFVHDSANHVSTGEVLKSVSVLPVSCMLVMMAVMMVKHSYELFVSVIVRGVSLCCVLLQIHTADLVSFFCFFFWFL